LAAEAGQKATVLDAEAQQKTIVLKAQALRQEAVLKAQATSEAMQIIADKLKSDPQAANALQFLLAQQYLQVGQQIGASDSSKVMFMDPRTIPRHTGRDEGDRRGDRYAELESDTASMKKRRVYRRFFMPSFGGLERSD
jgi:regulator of protease activity HflC (stomatin/prohibitin superfamily)